MTPVKDTSAQAVSALMALASSPSSTPKAGPGSDRPSTGGSANSHHNSTSGAGGQIMVDANDKLKLEPSATSTAGVNMNMDEGMDAGNADVNMSTGMITTSNEAGEPATTTTATKKSSGLSSGSSSTPATPRSSRTEPTAASSTTGAATTTPTNNPPEGDFVKKTSNITRFPNKVSQHNGRKEVTKKKNIHRLILECIRASSCSKNSSS